MKIIEDLLWHRNAMSVGAVPLPEPGEHHTVWLPTTELHIEGVHQLLWVPPYSELNGWDARPSDITLSQIVTARIGRTTRPPTDNRVECSAAILARSNLLAACKGPMVDMSCDALLLANLGSVVFWDQVHWAGTAAVGGMTFLDVVAGEATMAILITGSQDPRTVCYAQFSIAGSSSAALGCWPLQGDVLRAVERRLAAAVCLTDTGTP
jgi:hypothetical protein